MIVTAIRNEITQCKKEKLNYIFNVSCVINQACLGVGNAREPQSHIPMSTAYSSSFVRSTKSLARTILVSAIISFSLCNTLMDDHTPISSIPQTC